MRVLNCIYFEHDHSLLLLAALLCVFGAAAMMRLFQRMLLESGREARLYWTFLATMTSGAAVWATHFIAMLGYNPGVPVTLDGDLTAASGLIAVVGGGAGLLLATTRNRFLAAICGGGIIGLSIAAMHYVGMFAYRVDGIVHWSPLYVCVSLLIAVVLSALAIDAARVSPERRSHLATGLMVAAILMLHFTGMAGFSVTPLPGVRLPLDSGGFDTLVATIAVVSLMILGIGISTHLVDANARARAQEQLRHLALHDTLTGLANRRHFNEALQARCVQLADGGPAFTLLMIDLDRFKPVNELLGHPVGDKVLQKVACRLRRAVRADDLVARIGGDEFAVIAGDVGEGEELDDLAERIVELLARPFLVDGRSAELGASVGIALAPADGRDVESLTGHADLALYTAKREGRGRARLIGQQLSAAIHQRRTLEADLRRANLRDDFHLVYQPVRDAVGGQFPGAEALIRWDCPRRGLVSPAEFVPVAEELGLISRIGTAVLRQACSDAAAWPGGQIVAVNLSPVQLLDPRLPQIVADVLRDAGLAGSRLELEITETALLGNDELALRSLVQLRGLGVRIALDDFGTGYSSLSYLHRFPIDRIKIDKSFIQRLPGDENSVSIVGAIAQLGRSLNLQVTAEGIETDEQLRTATQFGCTQMQGFLISHPLPLHQVAAFFDRARNKEAA